MNSLKFIAYQPSYLNDCLNLFWSNLQGYFAAEEVTQYRTFLQSISAKDHYYVALLDDRLVACGGWDQQLKGYYLRWGIVERSMHHQGLGSQLLEFRVKKITQLYGPVNIYIKTSAKAHAFFEKKGFTVESIINDGIAPGIDEYQMCLKAAES